MRYLKTIFPLILSIFIGNAIALEKGNSAWLYGKETKWIDEIRNFNSMSSSDFRINYIFPETSVIHIDSEHKKFIMTYDVSVTQFYKKKLQEVKILPDVSFWVAHTNFKHWSVTQYQQAADQIATYINNDPNADGVFLDLESYQASLLPFYQRLEKDLEIHHKILSLIVRPGQENVTWFQALGKNAFVVLYGYDLHEEQDSSLPVSPTVYQKRLESAMTQLIKIAEMTHTPIMGGAPAIATTYEWEKKILDHADTSKNLINSYQQIDYLNAALQTYAHINSDIYLGYSIWAFVSNTQGQMYWPLTISRASWQLLIFQQKITRPL